MITEKQLANSKQVEDPTFSNHELTSLNYDRNVDKILKFIQKRPDLIHLFVASHNQDSVRNAITK
uniref:Proline dehydrogenase n=1 Tax=Romanomermis culicivorax TaxID=13658 RepID=A0A915JM32_ROMCU